MESLNHMDKKPDYDHIHIFVHIIYEYSYTKIRTQKKNIYSGEMKSKKGIGKDSVKDSGSISESYSQR